MVIGRGWDRYLGSRVGFFRGGILVGVRVFAGFYVVCIGLTGCFI